MEYSDSVYLSKFAIDPDLEYVADDLMEDFNLIETPIFEPGLADNLSGLDPDIMVE